jgi:hypothetical protein
MFAAERKIVVFPLTPALSLWERENRFRGQTKTRGWMGESRFRKTEDIHRRPLSPRERVRVRGKQTRYFHGHFCHSAGNYTSRFTNREFGWTGFYVQNRVAS